MTPLEDDVRRGLEAAAARVEVQPDAMPHIRRRIQARRSWRSNPRPWAYAFGTGVLTAAAIAAVFVAASSIAPQPSPPTAIAQPPPETLDPALPLTPGGQTPADPSGLAGTASLPIYYVGTNEGRLLLYREFHILTVGDGSLAAKTRVAVSEMLTSAAFDPDYRTLWPEGASVLDTRIDGDVVTVDLAGADKNIVGSEGAHQAVQQLLYTVAGVLGGDPGVRLLLDGREANRLWGSVDIGRALHKTPRRDVQAPVWLVSPQHGATVGQIFDVHIAGIVSQATAQLRVRQGGQIIHQQQVTLSPGAPSFGDIKISITLAPGAYTIETYEISPADGSEKYQDDHEIIVQ